MKANTSWKRVMIVVGLGVALSGVPAYPSVSEAIAADPITNSELYGGAASVTARKLTADPGEVSGRSSITALQAQASDAVMEWNQQAVTLTLLPASALSPVQQTRVMAIVQVAVHDAVNGITGKYETYLSPVTAPENSSPEAAAIAAAHHALRNLFSDQTASLDALYEASLTAHGLSQDDPGIQGWPIRRRRDPGVACQRSFRASPIRLHGPWGRHCGCVGATQ